MSTVGSSTHDETMSQRSDSSSINYHHIPRLEEEDNGEVRISVKYLKKLFRDNYKLYYGTFELNEKLYLHYKGFKKIENMHLFPDLKCIYLEGNGLSKIEGFDNNLKLKCLYIQENIFDKIENVNHLKELHYLNLNDNYITTIENLNDMPNLGTLQIKKNRIGKNGISDVIGLLDVPSISVLDISDNAIDDPETIDQVFVKMPNLAVLYLKGNPVVKKIKNYKKTLIAKMPGLKYLDDAPVFPEDRRYAEAFAVGGVEAEREERKKVKQEKEDEHWRNHEAFREMIRKAKEEKKQRDEEHKRVAELDQHQENIQPNSSQPLPIRQNEPTPDKTVEEKKNELKEMIEKSRQKREEKKSQAELSEDVPELEEVSPEELAKERENVKVQNLLNQLKIQHEAENKSENNSVVDVEDVKIEKSNSISMSITSETEENVNNVSGEAANENTDSEKDVESEEEKHLEDSTSEVEEESNKTEPGKQQDAFNYDKIDKNFSVTKMKNSDEEGEYLEELD